MHYQSFLIKYAEIGTKGNNRYMFEDALVHDIRRKLSRAKGEFRVTRERGRIYVTGRDDDFDDDEVIDCLQHVFGVVGICPMIQLENTHDYRAISDKVLEYFGEVYGDRKLTFKCETRRADKGFPTHSSEIDAEIGGDILDHFPNTSVDVHHPDVRLRIEIRQYINIFSEVLPGPGGMPLGTNGSAMLCLSGGIDSPVAGWMISKRGVTLDATYFHAPPYTSERAKQKVVDLARIISRYTGPIRLHVVNFTDIQLAIYEKCPHDELTIIMRRYMMRIAEHFAKEDGCQALITGESLGQVASQTMQSLVCTDDVCSMPVFRPLIGFDKQDIIDLSLKIGTYETSIEPYEDCCTIFVAKHPVTKPRLDVIKRSEMKLADGIGELMKKALETAEVIEVKA